MATTQQHLQSALDGIIAPTAERIGSVIAVGAIATPLWRDKLHEYAGVASDILPFLGCLWLVVQIVVKLAHNKDADAD